MCVRVVYKCTSVHVYLSIDDEMMMIVPPSPVCFNTPANLCRRSLCAQMAQQDEGVLSQVTSPSPAPALPYTLPPALGPAATLARAYL